MSSQIIISLLEKNIWEDIARNFNKNFPDMKRTPKQIKDHYYHSINPSLKRSDLTEEERTKLIG
jgi:hypothetical protein